MHSNGGAKWGSTELVDDYNAAHEQEYRESMTPTPATPAEREEGPRPNVRTTPPFATGNVTRPRTTANLSSRERSELMDRTVQQVRDLTAACNALHAQMKGLTERLEAAERNHAACERRLDKDEQAIAAKLSTFMARLRLLVLGR